MPHLKTCFFLLLCFETAAALVVDGPPAGQQRLGTCSAAIARIHDPLGRIASGVLLPGGRYVLTAAHVAPLSSCEIMGRGLVDFPASRAGVRSRWKLIYRHPKSRDLARVWDAAVIELEDPVSADDIVGIPILRHPVARTTRIYFAGFGRGGNGLQGDYRPPGELAFGCNFFDQVLSGGLLQELGLSADRSPLLVHRFEPGSNEAHFSVGDSGGPGLVFSPDGAPRVASLILGRHRGSGDHDHRLNGSFGELGISIDASALLPWLRRLLSQQR